MIESWIKLSKFDDVGRSRKKTNMNRVYVTEFHETTAPRSGTAIVQETQICKLTNKSFSVAFNMIKDHSVLAKLLSFKFQDCQSFLQIGKVFVLLNFSEIQGGTDESFSFHYSFPFWDCFVLASNNLKNIKRNISNIENEWFNLYFIKLTNLVFIR